MKPALVLYATRQGQAARIAGHSKVILIASVHAGKHEPASPAS